MVSNAHPPSRRLPPVLTLVVTVLLASCATQQQSKTVAHAGEWTILGGATIGIGAIVLARSQDNENDAFRIGFNGLALAGVVVGIGAVLGVSGLVGWATLPPAPAQ